MEKSRSNQSIKEEYDVLTQKFVKLNDEMHDGKQFGNYCRPCDMIMPPRLWHKHLSVHIVNNPANEAYCTHCNLVVFGSSADLDKLFIHHMEKHFKTENEPKCSSPENADQLQLVFNDQTIEKMEEANNQGYFMIPKPKIKDYSQSNSDIDQRKISPVFTKINRKMHMNGNGKGFFCIPCDTACHSEQDWIDHFERNEFHDDFDNFGSFDKCKYCELVLFANPSILAVYKKYHMYGHNHQRTT